jgi:hypothetical protein
MVVCMREGYAGKGGPLGPCSISFEGGRGVPAVGDSPSGQDVLYPLRYSYGHNLATGRITVFDVAVRVRKLANGRPVYDAPYMSRKQL